MLLWCQIFIHKKRNQQFKWKQKIMFLQYANKFVCFQVLTRTASVMLGRRKVIGGIIFVNFSGLQNDLFLDHKLKIMRTSS